MTGAGKLKERVTFQAQEIDDNGDRLGDWEDGFTHWARVVMRTRGEVALEQRIQGVQPVEITVLNDSATRDITTAWRALWNGQIFDIEAIAVSEDRRERVILAQSKQTNA